MPDSRVKRAAKIQNSIRQILFQEWDPIGVNDNSKLADEYDSYIAPIYRILTGSRSEDELIEFLYRTENDAIGISCDAREKLRPVAQKLLVLEVRL